MSKSCAKCGGRMEAGILLDHRDGGTRGVTEWLEGAPEKGWFGSIKVRQKRVLEVETYRCGRCGYLESYAPGA